MFKWYLQSKYVFIAEAAADKRFFETLKQRSEEIFVVQNELGGLHCRWNAYHKDLDRIDGMKHLPGALKTFGYCYHLHEDVFIGYSNETLTSVVRSHSSLNDIIINNKRFFENKPLVFFFSSSILSRS